MIRTIFDAKTGEISYEDVDVNDAEEIIEETPPEPTLTLEERITTTETKVVTLQETIDVIFGGV